MKFLVIAVVVISALGPVPSSAGLLGNVIGGVVSKLQPNQYLDILGNALKNVHLKAKWGNMTAEEQVKRLNHFIANVDRVNALKKLVTTFEMDITNSPLAFNSTEEFGALLGTKVPEDVAATTESSERERRAATTLAPPPASVEWRNTPAVTPVKNQGQCGSCWSFSANGAVVGAWYAKYKNNTNLSEQNLVDCVSGCDCNGGWMGTAYDYIRNNTGVDSDTSYPYETAMKTCRYKAANKAAVVSGYKSIPSGDETSLARAVAIGPVATAIDATNLQFYSGGFYTCTGTPSLNHGVLITGYGLVNGTMAWTIKNSWGDKWGYAGYFYIPKNGQNVCGVASAATYPYIN